MGLFSWLRRKPRVCVLVVEDDVPLRRFIVERLEANKVRVVETGNGNEALSLIRAQAPDCAVLDVMLPGKNGMQILAELRMSNPDLPVVVLTTLSGEGGLRQEAQKYGAAFLNKASTSLEVVIDTILRSAYGNR